MERFRLEKSQENGWWVVTDTTNLIVIRFAEHQFNETQQVTLLDDVINPDPLIIARAMREIGDWLSENHYELIF